MRDTGGEVMRRSRLVAPLPDGSTSWWIVVGFKGKGKRGCGFRNGGVVLEWTGNEGNWNSNVVLEIETVVQLRLGSYTLHPYIYTFTPTINSKYQIYPLYKIKPTHTPTFFFSWKMHNNSTSVRPHLFPQQRVRTLLYSKRSIWFFFNMHQFLQPFSTHCWIKSKFN